MTIQLTTISCKATNEEILCYAAVGLDLSLLGARTERFGSGEELSRKSANIGMLFASAQAATTNGIDFVCLSKDFVVSETGNPSLDRVKAAIEMIKYGVSQIAVVIAPEVETFNATLDMLEGVDSSRIVLSFPLSGEEKTDELDTCISRAKEMNVQLLAQVDAETVLASNPERFIHIGPDIRMNAPTPHLAREARFALRAAAQESGQELRVLLDIGVIISATRQAAKERLILNETISGKKMFSRTVHVIGTVCDIADATEYWLGQGAADGVVYLPASAGTDVASLVKGVIPFLVGRATA